MDNAQGSTVTTGQTTVAEVCSVIGVAEGEGPDQAASNESDRSVARGRLVKERK